MWRLKMFYLVFQCFYSMTESKIYDVIIIGGGTSGLAAASELSKLGNKNILVLEASNRLGGRINTSRTSGR